MRRSLAPAGLLLGWIACQGSSLTHIEIEGSDKVTVEQGTVLEALLGDLGFDAFTNMDITEAQELQNQGVEPGDIKDVHLVYFELEATAPQGGSLDFIEQMSLYVEAPGLERRLLASATEIPDGATTVSFDVEDLDLAPYVVSESMTLTTEVTGGRPEDDTTVEGRYMLDVGVTAQGACNQARKADES